MRQRLGFFGMVCICVFCACSAHAATRFNLLSFQPTAGVSALVTVRESPVLGRRVWSAGTSLDYGYRPFKATVAAVSTDLIRHLVTQQWYGALGVTDRLQVAIGLPIAWYTRFRDPDTLGPVSTVLGFGDLRVDAQFRLLSRDAHFVGAAVAPFLILPTGDDQSFLGEETLTGGGVLVVDRQLTDRLLVAVNLGALGRDRFAAYGLNFGSQFLASAGAAFRVTDKISVMGEMETRTPFDSFFQQKATSPTLVQSGAQWQFGRHAQYALNAGLGFGIVNGSYLPQYRGYVSIATSNVLAPRSSHTTHHQ